jgi:hypothetical protein
VGISWLNRNGKRRCISFDSAVRSHDKCRCLAQTASPRRCAGSAEKRTYIMTTRRITSGEELKYRNALAGLRGLGMARPNPRPLTFQSDAFALTGPIDGLRTLPDQEVARSEHQSGSLLLFALRRNEPHVRPRCCLTDRLSISRIVLLALHERLHLYRRDKLHLVPRASDLSCPVMRAFACLHCDKATRLRGKKREYLGPVLIGG